MGFCHVKCLCVSASTAHADVFVARAATGWRDAAAVATLVDTLAPGGVAGKVVVDATNPLTPFPELEVLCNGTSGGCYGCVWVGGWMGTVKA